MFVDGDRVEVVTGDLAGEQGYVDTWTIRADRARMYWVVIDGDYTAVPFLAGQLVSVDALVAA